MNKLDYSAEVAQFTQDLSIVDEDKYQIVVALYKLFLQLTKRLQINLYMVVLENIDDILKYLK